MFIEIGIGLAALIAGSLAGYALVIRPWHLSWGTTQAEQTQTLAGDDLLPQPTFQATRAITIHAPASAIWPWLVQMGQDRGGMYSYTWLENLVGAKMPTTDEILPAFQQREVGDTLWMSTPTRFGGTGYAVVAAVEANRSLVCFTQGWTKPRPRADFQRDETSGTWAFVLVPLDDHTTRLVIRDRRGQQPGWYETVMALLWEMPHFMMQRKLMLGVKQRAESTYQLVSKTAGEALAPRQQRDEVGTR